ncbi:MAG: DNA recombination protein RmuC [Saprospiraceae bacterium]
METGLIIAVLALGLIVGALASWFIAQTVIKQRIIEDFRKNGKMIAPEIHESVKKDVDRLQNLVEEKNSSIQEANQKLGAAQQLNLSLQEKLENHQKEIESTQIQLQQKFEILANRLFEEKSEKFTQQNSKQIKEILNPIKDKIETFEKRVNEVYKHESHERSTLKGEIKTLVELNQKISQEANNLTKALKGDTKKQGNWGEFILEKVLEQSGLSKGNEYEVQHSTTNENGRRLQPDVVVHLPDKKHLIIDAKVSLIAYEKLTNAEDEKDKQEHLKQHLLSLKTHIKLLSEKNYAAAKGLDSPEFVLLFVPIESSFSIAVQEDRDIFQYAWDLKIVIVSPSTLLATLRTVASLWKQEKQTKNALAIAKQAGNLYDKFVGFVEDLKKIESSIEQADKAYKNAFNKLQSGSGNLIRRAEKIRELGIKTSKTLPDDVKGELLTSE